MNMTEIDPTTPIELKDCHTQAVIKRGTYAQVKSFRRLADRKDMQYGAVRYIVNVLHSF